MSLLDRAKQHIVVFPQISYEDELGNTILACASVGYPARAEIQPARQSGTSARRGEQDNEGYETEENYRMRFTRKHDRLYAPLEQGAQIEWKGKRWSVVGHPTPYEGSSRTAHIDYMIRRN